MSQPPASFQAAYVMDQPAQLTMEQANLQASMNAAQRHALPSIQEMQHQGQEQPPPSSKANSRKRKKDGTGNDTDRPPAEPRRLRRSHEACARCRSKKIKCDSKHPKCGACASAGTPCHQEDRHRQVLTPRGHTDHVEYRLRQCDALLKRRIPGFTLENIDELLASEGIEVDPNGPPLPSGIPPSALQYHLPPPPPPPPAGFSPEEAAKAYPYPPHLPPPMPGYMYPPGMYPPMMQVPFNPHLHNVYHPQSSPPHDGVPPTMAAPARPSEVRGQDPQSNDLSTSVAIVKSFGVSSEMIKDLGVTESAAEKEDISVGSGHLTSGREDVAELEASSRKVDLKKWFAVTVRRGSQGVFPPDQLDSTRHVFAPDTKSIWLPKDRKMLRRIVEVYFNRLNMHRPVFTREEFEREMESLYDDTNTNKIHDPGFVCSFYFVLALGTLSELNHCATRADAAASEQGIESSMTPLDTGRLMPTHWPDYTEFFNRALLVKPDLRSTISSLQALILFHWYLYTERQGRSLWRLVGQIVRTAIEIGLHHDPQPQMSHKDVEKQPTFSPDECKLRIRLWGIIMVHDRGTSILLGRPLAAQPSDTNTPHPPFNTSSSPFSENFILSHEIAEIQADIVNSLYSPKMLSAATIMHHAGRIIGRMTRFRNSLPIAYKWYFGGTDEWTTDDRVRLVKGISEDQGLTLLKISIARILLLRAVFNSKQLSYEQRATALKDAVITSHNVIIVHNQLIQFPDIAFFTSPIPLHIAAMVILYGQISLRHADPLTEQERMEDLWLALDMIPKFRWRWERKDLRGEHPLISQLASRVMHCDLHQIRPTGPPVLLSEPEWTMVEADDESLGSPSLTTIKSQHSTPTLPTQTLTSPASTIHDTLPDGAPMMLDNQQVNGLADDDITQRDLDKVPVHMFYPFYPERTAEVPASSDSSGSSPTGYERFFANPAESSYGCQPSETSYIAEELDNSGGVVNYQWAQPQGPPQLVHMLHVPIQAYSNPST